MDELCELCETAPRDLGRKVCRRCHNDRRNARHKDRYANDPKYRTSSLASAVESRIRLAELPCEICGKNPRYKANRMCSSCRNNMQRDRYASDEEYRERVNEMNRANVANIRLQVVNGYGGKCVCCSETEPMFLTIDHIHRDGASERKNDPLKQPGIKFYRHLLSLGCPTDRYQLLCYNCNCGRERNKGICPHQVPASELHGS